MTDEEFGFYMRTLLVSWGEEKQGTLPCNHTSIGVVLGRNTRTVRKFFKGLVGECWPERDGSRENKKLMEVADKQRKRSDHGKAGAAGRWPDKPKPEHPPGISPSDGSIEREIKKRPPPTPRGVYSPEFEAFWKAWPKHPRKTDKPRTFQKWQRALSLSADPASIMVSLEEWKVSDQWTKDGGNFIPGPKAWMNQEAYLAEFDTGPGPDSPEVRAAVAQYRKLLAEKVPAGHARSRVLDSIKPEVRAAVVKVIDAE